LFVSSNEAEHRPGIFYAKNNQYKDLIRGAKG